MASREVSAPGASAEARSPRAITAGTSTYPVPRDQVREALAALLRRVNYRPPPSHGRRVEAPGHYAGLVRIGRETVAVTTDTVGTKVLLAGRLDRWEEVGEDLVAVNVNDLASVGARPAGLVDVITCARPDAAVFERLGVGIDRGLRAAGASLLGGETAVVPDLVEGLDLGGTAIGFFPRGRQPVTGARIRPGDRLIGVPARGFHANGYTLIRRLVREHDLDLDRPRESASVPLGEELLAPTRIYVPVSEALAGHPAARGFAHISGGGVRNLARLHPGVRFVLDEWPSPAGAYAWLASLGRLGPATMYETFNMGIGFVIVVAPRGRAELLRRLARAGVPDARPVGHVERGRGVFLPGPGLEFEGYT